MRVRGKVLSAAMCALALLGVMTVVVTSGASPAQGRATTRRVIVVFKSRAGLTKNATLAERAQVYRAAQAPVLRELRSTGASNVHAYSLIDAVAATVTSSEANRLKHDDAVSEVVPDQIIRLEPTFPAGTSGAKARQAAASATSTAATASGCSTNPATPQLNPEALSLIHADSDTPGAQTARSLGFDGSGVTVGFIADGLDIDNQDFIRANGTHVFVDYKDFSGLGTGVDTGGEEAFGDASSIAAQGRYPYNVEGYGPHAVSTPCYVRVEGVAPGASLVGLDVFGDELEGFNSSFLNAINYAVTVDHVNVLNESLGNNFYPDDTASLDLIKAANDAAVAAGTTVVASSGDAGSTSTIGTPATDPNIISSGATTSYRVDLQDGYGGAQFPGITGYADNDISSFSSGGFEQDGQTVDTVAPGELNWALCSTDNTMYSECTSYAGKATPVIPFGGTSESSPLTAGVAALVDQAYKKTHGTFPTPAVVKEIISSTADDIGSPAEQQGAGLVDAYKAVEAAESFQAPASTPTPVGSTTLSSVNQLNATDAPGTPESLTDTVTNNSGSAQTITTSGRTLGAYTPVNSSTVVLSDTASPKTTNWAGTTGNYEPVTFTVPSGENRLSTSIAAVDNVPATGDPNLLARVRITLVDPNGKLAAYSVPQGDGNYGNVQVTNPAPGRWTAYVWSNTSAYGGTTGPVRFGASVAKYASFGSVTPASLTLQPGQSAPVTIHVTTPSTPGDSAGAIVLTGPAGTSTVPVTLRSTIPSGSQSFTQTLTGGNGRGTFIGQTFYYQLSVGANQPELNAAIQLADNPNNPFTAELVSPSGEAQSVSANELVSIANGTTKFTDQLGAQLHVLDPAQGAWTLIVTFAPQVSGTALSEPFTVSTNETAVPASASGLPDAASTKLPAGQPVTVNVTVKNTGNSPEEYFTDARNPLLPTTPPLALVSQTGSPNVTAPLNATEDTPAYLVPTDSTAFTATASTTGATPIQFDTGSALGDPDISSNNGTAVSASFADTPIAPGLWSVTPTTPGPFGKVGVGAEPVSTAFNVTTAPFDPAVSSQTGDLWSASTNPSAIAGLAPVVVGPGQTGTIPVTITPQGKSGTAVTGTLYVDDLFGVAFQTYSQPNGSQVAALPYSYTIK